ncbi:hypothetical protein [Sphingopyxis chilensis]
MMAKTDRPAHKLLTAIGVVGLLFAPATGNAGVVDGVQTADGLTIYLGVVPAALVRGHPPDHPEAQMHGGAPGSSHSMHIVAAVFDRGSGARITKANVVAHILEPGGIQRSVRLQPMTVAGALTFGGYTTFARGIDYRIGIRVDRPPHMPPSQQAHVPHAMHRVASVTAHFTYTHD